MKRQTMPITGGLLMPWQHLALTDDLGFSAENGGSAMLRGVMLLLLLLFAAGTSAAQVHTEAPDTILFNGRIFTATDATTRAGAIAIKGARIVAVGENQQILSMAGANTRQIDLVGHVVIPGINDVHTHFEADLEGTLLDFAAPDPECKVVLQRLEEAVHTASPRDVLLGIIGPAAFVDPSCTPSAMNRIAPVNAAVLWL